uniref:hypothetical protein n=1 Tax=Streptomyces sp. NBC_01001 TaxID=2903713 RepID=UPI002F90FC0B
MPFPTGLGQLRWARDLAPLDALLDVVGELDQRTASPAVSTGQSSQSRARSSFSEVCTPSG